MVDAFWSLEFFCRLENGGIADAATGVPDFVALEAGHGAGAGATSRACVFGRIRVTDIAKGGE